jgi:hypothetical protein
MSLVDLVNKPQVTQFLLDPGVYDILDGIATTHGLPVERSEEFLDLTEAVLDEQVHYTQMPDVLAQAFGIERAQAEKVAADLAGQRLLPFEYYLPGIQNQIVAWGGKVSDYPDLRIEREQLSALEWAKRLTGRGAAELSDVLLKRAAFLLEEFLNGKIDEAGLRSFLGRSAKVGGLGLAAEQTDKLMAAVTKERLSIQLIDPDAMAAPVKSIEPVTLQAEAMPKKEIEIAPTHELAAEVPVVSKPEPKPEPKPIVEKKVAPPRVSTPAEVIDPDELKMPMKRATQVRKLAAPVKDALEATVAAATEQARAVLKAKKISEKVFADVAGKAIRGLRDVYQTRDMIERDWSLKGGELATVMDAITGGIASYNATAPRPKTEDVKPKIAQAEQDVDQNDARFASLTKPAEDETPVKARAQLTVGSVPLSTPEGQRKVVDIVSANRLAGPIEQLGKMTPAEFRRLASDPNEAAQKIDDLLSALQATSYEERVKGVLAWRESPMNQLYLQMTEEALAQGLALPEISSRRRAAGKDSLSPGEVKAMALLNAKMRF